MKQPPWLKSNIYIEVNGKYKTYPASEKRITHRENIHNLCPRITRRQADDMYEYFKEYFSGKRFAGLTKYERKKLYKQENGICYVCKEICPQGGMTIEHKIARADLLEQGIDPDFWENLSIAHMKCNNEDKPSYGHQELLRIENSGNEI